MSSCGIDTALELLSGKWSLKILLCLNQKEVIRFNDLKKMLPGISSNKLRQCLKEFEQYKIVKRTQYNEIPPKVEYSLTKLGQEVRPAIILLNEWGQKVVTINNG